MTDLVEKTWNFVRRKKQDYNLVFPRNSPAAQRVLADLSEFCRANDTVFNSDQRFTDVLIGRNEVFRRIQNFLNLSSADLYQLRTGQQLDLGKKEPDNE